MNISKEFLSGYLELEDGSTYSGYSFGSPSSAAGEVVFNTGMVGYPESITDPSYCGQILALTYPLIGNYGAFLKSSLDLESDRIQVKGLIVSDYSQDYSHWQAEQSLAQWLRDCGVPAITGIDTRALTKRLREKGSMLGRIIVEKELVDFYDPNEENLVDRVSTKTPLCHGDGKYHVVLIDCGHKRNILRSLLKYDVKVTVVPWDYDLQKLSYDGLLISNGPGDPLMCEKTVDQVRWNIEKKIPILGICLGHQILSLAVGAKTYKLKYGHRGQNQPVLETGTQRCFITSQNHGYAVDISTIPEGWRNWYVNLNDDTSEGLIHKSERFMSVQFHPEASPGPVDTMFLFKRFFQLMERS